MIARRTRPARRKAKVESDDGIERKYASAHDLRRAFGLRWASLLMPADLMKLMRHESIDTTMRYYVGRESDALADTLWAAVEPHQGNDASSESRSEVAEEKAQNLAS